MSSVNFDTTVGGDGSTVTDDASPTTGLANGGHRTRFVPALAQIVAIALWVKTRALDVLGYANSASADAGTATTQAGIATTQAGIATTKAGEAGASADAAAASAATINLPSVAGKALNFLRVKADESGYEHRTSAQVLSDIGAQAAASAWLVKTSAYTAVAGDMIFANTAGGAFTVTLPASPANGDTVSICDYAGSFDTANLTIGRNGQNIMGLAQDMTVAVKNAAFDLIYSGHATYGWRVK